MSKKHLGTTMTKRQRWTSPYCGVQHLLDLPKGYQITMEDHGAFTSAYVLNLQSTSRFTPTKEASFPTILEAAEWAEKQAEAI